MHEMYYTAVLKPDFWLKLISEYEETPRSRRYKLFNEHWHNDFLLYVKEKLGVSNVNSRGIITIFEEQAAVLFQLQYGQCIAGDKLRPLKRLDCADIQQ